tara:strand:- start:7188 stop:7361 length:174 start_codon:yes stop_codon:yes gene_type:complete
VITIQFENIEEVGVVLKALDNIVREQGLPAARVALPIDASIRRQVKEQEQDQEVPGF